MSWRGSTDDSSLASSRHVPFPGNELKTMTLGRRKKIVPTPPLEEAAPPPPVRSHSRRFDPSSLTAPGTKNQPPSTQTEGKVGGIVSSIASSMETTTKKLKPPVKLPPKKIEPIAPPKTEPPVCRKPSIKRQPSQKSSVKAAGFLSAKAQLQAKLEGAAAIAKEEPKMPPKEIHTRSIQNDNNHQTVPEPPPAKPSKLPPKVPKKYSPSPASNRDSDLSSSGSGVFRIKESSSTESVASNDPTPPPLPPAPFLLPNIANSLEPTKSKVTRSHSTRSDHTTKPPLIEPTDRRNSIDHDPQRSQIISHARTAIMDTQSKSLKQPSGAMDLGTLISKGTHFFPTQVSVCKGYYSKFCDSFSKFDKLQLHFVKHAKVGVVKDEYSEEQYTIPLSSSLEFGILYEGEGADVSQYIPRVEDLMALKPLPAVVLATKPYNAGAQDKSIEENEMLFLKKVSKSLLGKGRVLEAVTAEGVVKKLAGKCEGDFSIHPMHIKMTLSTIVKQSISLPQRVYLLPDPSDQMQEHLTDNMTQQPVCLETLRGETSVICSVKGEDKVMDISKDIGIQVEIDEMTEQDIQTLANTSKRLHSEFNPTTLSYVINKATQREYTLQCLLNQQLLQGQEMDGVHLQLPSTLPQPPKPSQPSHITHSTLPPLPPFESTDAISIASSEGVEDPNTDYEDINSALATLPEEDSSKLNKAISKKKEVSKLFTKFKKATTKEKKQTSDPPYEDTTFDTPPLPPKDPPTITRTDTPPQDSYEPVCTEEEGPSGDYSDVRNMDTHLKGLKKVLETGNSQSSLKETESNYVQMNSKIASIMTELTDLKEQVRNLTATVEALRGSGAGQVTVYATSTPPQLTKAEEEERSRNKEFLKTLSHKQVLSMLDKMSVSDYKTSFEQQSITGEQLLELDDKAVDERFGTKNRYQRWKLLRITSGAVKAII